MGDENDKVLDIFFEGQKAIFAKLEALSGEIKAIPLHGLEIVHIKTAIAEMKSHCGKQHPEGVQTQTGKPDKPACLSRQIASDLARATALFLFFVLCFTCFNNVQPYLADKHTVTVAK